MVEEAKADVALQQSEVVHAKDEASEENVWLRAQLERVQSQLGTLRGEVEARERRAQKVTTNWYIQRVQYTVETKCATRTR
jgi:hypothetical protein